MSLLALMLSLALAATYLVVGLVKILIPRDTLVVRKGMGWAEGYSDRSVKGIGTAEVLGAIGLLVPWCTGILPALTPVAAIGLAVLQSLAIRLHLRRREPHVVPGNATLLALALLVAILRFVQLAEGA